MMWFPDPGFFRRSAGLIALLLSGLVAPAGAADLKGWACEAEQCTEAAPQTFATLTGTFVHGADLSGKTNADRIAALEQQSLREFEFAIGDAAIITTALTLDTSYRPDDWPAGIAPAADGVTVLMWRSADGESFERLAEGAMVQPGDVLLIGVRQARTGTDTQASYYPARWSVLAQQRRVRPEAGQDTGGEDPQMPVLLSGDGDPDPQEAAVALDVPVVSGVSGLEEPAEGGADTASSAGSGEVALELQRELARVGCYSGALDGLWGPASRRAMGAFNAATGALLPVETATARALVGASRATAPVCGAP